MADKEIALPGGDTVIVNDDRRSLQFYIGDLYKYRLVEQNQNIVVTGGRYVPNVNDMVFHYTLGTFRVSSVDPTTYVANLTRWDIKNDTPEVSEEDQFLSSGSGYQSESWRIYLDTRTLPYHLEIDEGFRTYGNKSAYIKLFRGIDVTETGEVISAYYNQNNEYVGDRIPLEVVANVVDDMFSGTAEINNISIKAPSIGYTTKDLSEGEYITLVAYSQDGTKVRGARFIVHKTNVYRRVDDNQKRVTGIQLISPYLRETEPNILDVPININLATLSLEAKVSYSDGSSIKLPVGDEDSGSKFMIYGLKYWSPSVPDVPQKISLTYRLSPSEEYSRMEGESESGLVKEPYTIIASEINPSMSLKLFSFPTWNGSAIGYGLDHWLYDLTRLTYYKVPANAIEFSETSRVFNGLDYSSAQTLTVGVSLGDLDPSWGTHRHAQTLQIALLRSGGLPATNWRVRHTNSQPEWYGEGKEAISTVGAGQNRFFNITAGLSDLESWLEALYYAQGPLYDNLSEARAPRPTHFIISTKTRNYDFPLNMWNGELSIISDLTNGQTVYIRFVRRDNNGELQLGIAGLPVHNA